MQNQAFHSNVPISPANYVYLERPQVHQLLEKAVQSPLVTVVAGAGYGKTSAVHSFTRSYSVITSWIQLSDRDNHGYRFWENFTQAVAAISKTSAEKLRDVGFPQTERQFDRYFAVPRDDVIPNRKYLFVYDDFHLLEDPAVLRFMERSITVPFQNITSIIISRRDPPFNLMNLLSKGILAQITEDELRFSQQEMTRYFALQNLKVPLDTAASIYQDTEGWAFAIHLAGLSLRKGAPGEYGRSLMRFNIFKLIESEILAAVSGKMRRFLIKLSLVDRLPRELIMEFTGDTDLAGELEKMGPFVRFDTYLNAYRIHHLFLVYLQGKQDCLSGDEKREVYSKAGRWCAEHNLKMDAFSYYEKAEDYEGIIALVYTLPMLIPEAMAEFLLDLFERTPPDRFSLHAIAYVIHTRLLNALGRFGEAEKRLNTLIQEYKALPSTPFNSQVLFRCNINLGFTKMFSCIFSGDYGFDECFKQAASYFASIDYRNPPVASILTLNSYVCGVGRPEKEEMEKFIAALDGAEPFLAETLNGYAFGLADLARAELAFFKTSLEESERYCSQALRKARSRNQYEIETRVLYGSFRVQLALGNLDRLPEIIKQLEAQREIRAYQTRFIHYEMACGWLYAHLEMPDKLAPWLKDEFEEIDLNSLSLGMETMVRAKYQFAEKRYSAALASLEGIRANHFAASMLMGRIEMKIMEALCRYRGGDLGGALATMRDAYVLAEPGGLWMPFIEMGRDMRAFTGAALKETEEAGCPLPRPWLERIQRNAAAYGKKFFAAQERFRGAGRGSQRWLLGAVELAEPV